MRHLISDLASGVRMLVKYPTLSIVAILTFGLGIGLTTTVFGVVNGGLFKGLPFEDPERVVSLVASNPARGQPRQPISVHDLEVWQARQTMFERIGAFSFTAINLAIEEGRPERFSAGQLTVAAFETLGVKPIRGRGLQAGDDRPGAEPVLILSYEVWRDRFGGSEGIFGQRVRASGVQRTVIGVMPERFGFPVDGKLWIPLTVEAVTTPRGKGPNYQVIARLKPDVSFTRANAEAAAIAAQLESDFPDTNRGLGARVMPYAENILGPEIYGLLYTMLGAGIGVLLIACVNVSNLLVARASLRRREAAVRLALGASRSRIVRLHLTEVLVLALAGGFVGMLISSLGMRWFVNAMSISPPPFWMSFEVDARTMIFVVAVVLGAALFAGLVPALRAARTNVTSAMRDDSRSSTSGRLGRFSNVLVVVELAVSCGLLIAAGLMIKSVVQLRNVPMPFAIDHVLTARINLPRADYQDVAACIRFYEDLLPRLQTLPGVEAATLSDGLPAAGNGAIPIQIEGQTYATDTDVPLIREGIVTPGYFETFQTPVLRGRSFTTADTAANEMVAIVNESFARVHFPNGDVIGRHLKKGGRDSANPWLKIVGVVPDLLMEGVGNSSQSPVGFYIPIAQSDVSNFVSIAVRARGDESQLTPAVRAAVASLDADLAIYDTRTMRDVIRRQTWFYGVFGTFFVAFGLCALFLAAAGLYGVTSFAVTQRTRELGVRSALGAGNTQLMLLVMKTMIVQLVIGLGLGLALGLAASGFLSPVLYHVDPRDQVVLATVLVSLAVSSLLASLLPARRVTRIDPVIALAAE
jgi:predicted permease